MKSTGFKVVAVLSALATFATIVALLTEPFVGAMFMLVLGPFHIFTALVMLVFQRRIPTLLRRLLLTYCAGVVAYFAIGGVLAVVDPVSGDAGLVLGGGAAMLLAIFFSVLKFAVANAETHERVVKIDDDTILDA